MNLIDAVLGFAISAWLTGRFCDPNSRFHILDHPNERSLHAQPKPRGGGLAILAGIAMGLVLAVWRYEFSYNLVWLALSMLCVAVVSYMDDRRHVPVMTRLAVHSIAAGVLLWGGFSFQIPGLSGSASPALPMLGGLLSLFFIVWMINLYNFMDGMDGLAGGMAVFGFGAFALLGWQAGNSPFMFLTLFAVAACGGFLLFNFPPARIFMGDVGSSTLGLLVAAFSLWGARDGVFPLWIAVLVFSPFIMDATLTLLRRALRGEKFWQAHKTHYYQKLAQAGWGHRKTVLVQYAIMSGCGITALLTVHAPVAVQVAALAAWITFYLIFFSWISRYASRYHGSV